MTAQAQQLIDETLKLDDDERAEVANELLPSLAWQIGNRGVERAARLLVELNLGIERIRLAPKRWPSSRGS